jgi:hypothetical protein
MHHCHSTINTKWLAIITAMRDPTTGIEIVLPDILFSSMS